MAGRIMLGMLIVGSPDGHCQRVTTLIFFYAAYHFPNDEAEAERLDLQYEVLKQVLDGKSHLAPLSKKRPPRRILDIGTGTGTWCIEMGDAFPGATVIGTDLSPTLMPSVSSPNVSFLVDDL
jgi:metalloendopeptidase OMA1, mitochondrial